MQNASIAQRLVRQTSNLRMRVRFSLLAQTFTNSSVVRVSRQASATRGSVVQVHLRVQTGLRESLKGINNLSLSMRDVA